MKTNKIRITALLLVFSLMVPLFSGCTNTSEDPKSYRVYDSSLQYKIVKATLQDDNIPLYADSLCVPPEKNKATKKATSRVANGGGLFNTATHETLYAKNINKKMYPASTTKILTAYVAIKYGDLDEVYTVSANAANQASDSSVCGLSAGDKMTLKDLLYGLMLASGNDAAIAIAEGMDGSVKKFMKRVNKEAQSLGATNTHFVNPNGLHDEDHYTTVYDMYLIFNAAIENKTFVKIISSAQHTAKYKNGSGTSLEKQWFNTNYYLKNKRTPPDGITVIGGKTGTTGQAGYCLVLLSKNSKKEKLVSIVFDADSRWNLYLLMNELLALGK